MKKIANILFLTSATIILSACSSLEDRTYRECDKLMNKDIYDIKKIGFTEDGIMSFRRIHKRVGRKTITHCAINEELSIVAQGFEEADLVIFAKYGTIDGQTVTEANVEEYPSLYRKY